MTTTSIQNHSILSLCARIQAAALTCGDYHIFVDWQAHVSALAVRAYPMDTEYNGEQVPLFAEHTYLDSSWCDPIAELTAIIDQLQRLGVEV